LEVFGGCGVLRQGWKRLLIATSGPFGRDWVGKDKFFVLLVLPVGIIVQTRLVRGSGGAALARLRRGEGGCQGVALRLRAFHVTEGGSLTAQLHGGF
jgi:hypothetical protein